MSNIPSKDIFATGNNFYSTLGRLFHQGTKIISIWKKFKYLLFSEYSEKGWMKSVFHCNRVTPDTQARSETKADLRSDGRKNLSPETWCHAINNITSHAVSCKQKLCNTCQIRFRCDVSNGLSNVTTSELCFSLYCILLLMGCPLRKEQRLDLAWSY